LTTLVSWVSYSDTGQRPELPKAIYIASDSRITWGSVDKRWDSGRKIFASALEPHIFGYCGDVVFPALFLSQLNSAIDEKLLFEKTTAFSDRQDMITHLAKEMFDNRYDAPCENFTILHASRSKAWPDTEFGIFRIDYKAGSNSWSSTKLNIPDKTSPLIFLGSGGASARDHVNVWNKSDVAGTSRAIYSGVCEAIASGKDLLSGGVPQVAALLTQKSPKQLGFFRDGRYFYNGFELPFGPALTSVKWFDSLFRQIDPATSLPLQGARRFAIP